MHILERKHDRKCLSSTHSTGEVLAWLLVPKKLIKLRNFLGESGLSMHLVQLNYHQLAVQDVVALDIHLNKYKLSGTMLKEEG